MKVGCTLGSSAGSKFAGLPVLTILFSCCMLVSNTLYAQTPAETEDSPETVTTETTVAEVDAVMSENEEAEIDVKAKLEEILKQNKKCLKCHSKDKTKTLEDGEEMSLQVHADGYNNSAHGEVRCISCHRAIGKRKHPSKKTNIAISNSRDYSVEMNTSCRKCHRQKYTEYKNSIHASLVTQGSEKAPVCTACHNAHAVESMEDYSPEAGYPCKTCHENIFNAYAESVHGRARIDGNNIRDSHIQSPICSDCHKSHEVTALSIGDGLRSTCIGCHENTTLLHNQWLPNAGTHLDIVSCAVCHAPFARRKFDLHLYDNVAQGPVVPLEGEDSLQVQLQAIVDEGTGEDPLEVWKLRSGLGQNGEAADISLRSRMEVMSGVAAHQIANKSFAVRTCDSCHQSDSRQSENVTLSFTQSDGRKVSFEADRSVLSTVSDIDSISDFYALGGNPNKILDYLLILAALAGFAIPIGHFTMGKFIAKQKGFGEK